MPTKKKSKRQAPPAPTEREALYLSGIDTYAKAMQHLRGSVLALGGPFFRKRSQFPADDADFSAHARLAWWLAEKFGFTRRLEPPPIGPMSPHQAGTYVARAQAAFEDRSRKEHWKERIRIAQDLDRSFLTKLVSDTAWEIQRQGVGTKHEQAVRFLRLLITEVTAFDRVWAKPYGITIYWDAAAHSRIALLEFLPTLDAPSIPEGSVTFIELRTYLRALLHLADADRARLARAEGKRVTAHFSDGRRNCLVALLGLKAFERDARQASPEIARKAAGSYSTSWTKRVLRQLVVAGEVDSLGGKSGGYWLTQTGRAAAEQISSE